MKTKLTTTGVLLLTLALNAHAASTKPIPERIQQQRPEIKTLTPYAIKRECETKGNEQVCITIYADGTKSIVKTKQGDKR